jgi:hypothetical protein
MTNAPERAAFREGKQVRLVSDLERSLAYYRDVLGCETDGWGHAVRGGLTLILQQAQAPDDVRPNAASAKRDARHPDLLFSPLICNGIIATYFACLEVTDLSSIPDGMVGFALPPVDYARATCTTATIGDGHGKVQAWISENGYEHLRDNACPMEIYYIDETSDNDERVDILMPIRKAS